MNPQKYFIVFVTFRSSLPNSSISNKFLERKYEPLISNNYINDNINDNLNQNFFKSPSNLKSNIPFYNTLKLDSENNYILIRIIMKKIFINSVEISLINIIKIIIIMKFFNLIMLLIK